jgi:cobalt-zinc-cadmium efflux system outer membrane protein
MEVSRLEAETRALMFEIAAAEAMLVASLALPQRTVVPALSLKLDLAEPRPSSVLVSAALARRPELRAASFAIQKAQVEVDVMESMYTPMAMVQTGPAYTMSDGPGWMAMVGLSIPIWRSSLNAGVREAEAMVAMTRYDLSAMKRMVRGQVEEARERVLGERSRVLSLREEILPRARQAIDPTFSGYAAGQLPLVSLIEAVRALWATESELVQAEMRLGLAWARLQRVTGSKVRR